MFYSLLPNGTVDNASRHGSCPTTQGEKWSATVSTARSNSATSQQLLQQHHITSLTSRQYHITSHQPQQLNNNQQPPQQHITPGHNNKTTATQQLLQLQLHQQLQLRHTLIITCSNSAAAGARIADMLHVTLYRQSPCTANHPYRQSPCRSGSTPSR